jgi:hypothetical protein
MRQALSFDRLEGPASAPENREATGDDVAGGPMAFECTVSDGYHPARRDIHAGRVIGVRSHEESSC